MGDGGGGCDSAPTAAVPAAGESAARMELPQNPGPGAHDTYKESATLDEVQKRWPGLPSASAFSSFFAWNR